MPKATVRANARTLSSAEPAAKLRRAPSTAKTPAATPARPRRLPAVSPASLLSEVAEFAAAAPILEAVGVHRSAHQRFERAVDATDDTAAKREGRAITDADEVEWNEAGAAEARALRRLVRTRPTTVEGLRALIGYSVNCFRDQGWDEATLSQLLKSILESAPLRSPMKTA
jgi:hypothetical protein